MPTILHITTVADSFVFMRGQLDYIREHGYDIAGLTSPGPRVDAVKTTERIPLYTVEMPRRITPFQDLLAIAQIVFVIREIQPDIVHGHTPKGGLLAMIAATLAGIPRRIYHMRGLPMDTAEGAKRTLLATTERISCELASQVITVGKTMRETAITEGLCPPDKIQYIAHGSSNGVDAAERFNPERQPRERRAEIRSRYDIPTDAIVIGFVGRLVGDKGIMELTTAWENLHSSYPDAHLLLVGPFEDRDALPPSLKTRLLSDPRVHLTGFVHDTAAHYAAMDIFCLPTHREGFPNSPLEAAAMALPVIASDIGPCQEAVANGQTGLLHKVGDPQSLGAALKTYLDDPDLRRQHGIAGRQRTLDLFQPEQIWAGIEAIYAELLSS